MKREDGLRIALVGHGPWAERLEGITRATGNTVVRLAPEAPRPDALIIASGAGDGYAHAREALCSGTAVLVSTPAVFSPWQVSMLEELARRHGALLRFVERFGHRPELRFLARLVGGNEPFWQPLYLRVLRTAPARRGVVLDALASETLALCDALLQEAPRDVTAMASPGPEVGEVCAIFLMATYRRGPVLQCTVSLAEPEERWEVTITAPGRMIRFDLLGGDGGLRVTALDQHDLLHTTLSSAVPRGGEAGGTGATLDEDGLAAEVRAFLRAVQAQDSSVTNAGRWTRVAAVWWGARQSMSFGGPVTVVVPRPHARDAAPPLRVIEGGGGSAREVERPALAVVPR